MHASQVVADWKTVHVAYRLHGFTPGQPTALSFWKNTRWGKSHASIDGGASSACGITFTPSKVRWTEPRLLCVQCKDAMYERLTVMMRQIEEGRTP